MMLIKKCNFMYLGYLKTIFNRMHWNNIYMYIDVYFDSLLR